MPPLHPVVPFVPRFTGAPSHSSPQHLLYPPVGLIDLHSAAAGAAAAGAGVPPLPAGQGQK